MESIWENLISLNSHALEENISLGKPVDYKHLSLTGIEWDRARFPLDNALSKDVAPLPSTAQREGYYGDNHFAYWASGLSDLDQIQSWLDARKKNITSFLDLGCATGRFMRHLHFQTGATDVFGCDINRLHVDWCCRNLPRDITVFQNTSLPTLPLDSNSVDMVTGFSVFTHIEAFDTTWLMELRRILKPGGVAWLTFHGDRTWRNLDSTWPIYNAIATHPDTKDHLGSQNVPTSRFVLRWQHDKSYTANVFYRYEYIRSTWGRFLNVEEIFPSRPPYQDVVVMTK